MENNIYTFSNRDLFSIKLSDNTVKAVSEIHEDCIISEIYLINESGTLKIKENNYFQDSEDIKLNKGDLLLIVRDYSIPTKHKYSTKYRAVVVSSEELANIILSNRKIDEEKANKQCKPCDKCCIADENDSED